MYRGVRDSTEGKEEAGSRDKEDGARGERGLRRFLWSSFNCFFTLVNFEMVFCKEAILESWIHLEASRYQLKYASHSIGLILEPQSSNFLLRKTSLGRSEVSLNGHWSAKLSVVKLIHLVKNA